MGATPPHASEEPIPEFPPDGAQSRSARWRSVLVARQAVIATAFVVLASAAPAGASTAPGLTVFSNVQDWISQYGWAGLPVAASFGGLMMVIEHHQQRTGNAIRAKGYIFSAAAGCVVISLATAITSGVQALVGS